MTSILQSVALIHYQYILRINQTKVSLGKWRIIWLSRYSKLAWQGNETIAYTVVDEFGLDYDTY